MRFCSLGSGSAGNATVIQAAAGTTVSTVLVDCGFGIRQIDARLARAGLCAADLSAIFITHEHADHVGCAVQLAEHHGIPLWMSHGTWSAMGSPVVGDLLHFAVDGEPFAAGDLQVHPFTVPHDAREPLQITVTNGSRRLAVLTDLGHGSSHVIEQVRGCHAMLLESNHDRQLLEQSAYPAFLKARVAGRFGHLSNEESGFIAGAVHHGELGHVVAAHLSAQNNRPELARASLAEALGRQPADIFIASQTAGTPWLAV